MEIVIDTQEKIEMVMNRIGYLVEQIVARSCVETNQQVIEIDVEVVINVVIEAKMIDIYFDCFLGLDCDLGNQKKYLVVNP